MQVGQKPQRWLKAVKCRKGGNHFGQLSRTGIHIRRPAPSQEVAGSSGLSPSQVPPNLRPGPLELSVGYEGISPDPRLMGTSHPTEDVCFC